MAFYEVTLEGFTVNNQTWDHALNVDGWGDEVYVNTDVRVIDQAGAVLVRSEKSTAVMGIRTVSPPEYARDRPPKTEALEPGTAFLRSALSETGGFAAEPASHALVGGEPE